MATKHDFIVKNGLRVGKSLTVDSDVTITGALNVTGNVTGSYAGFDSDFNVALDGAALNGTGLSYNSTTNTLSITNTGVDSATYGSASLVPVLKINAQGQIDSAGTVSVAGVSSTAFDSASHTLTINTADGGSFNQIVQTKMPGTSGSFGSAALVPVITVNQYGLVDSINEVSVAGVSTFDFDSATGQLTIGTADGGSFSQVLTLDPYTTTDVTFGSVTADSAVVSQVSFSTSNEHLNYEEGAVWYDATHKTLNYWGDDSAVIHEIGIEEHQRVYNNTGGPIAKGTPLYYSGNYDPGGTPAVPTVGKADATDVNAYNAQGLAAGNIPNNSYGYVILSGLVEGVDTSALSAGQNFFVGLTPGAVQNSSPLYPNYPMCLGWVVKSDATNGSLLVNQQNHSVNSFRVRTSAHVGDDLIVGGNLTVTGTQTITSTENVQIGGNIQYLNAGDTIGEANTTFVGTGLDDAFFSGHYNGDSSSKSFYVKIDATGTPDTFEWGFDSSVGTEATGISITGNDQLLDSAYGISIKFAATTGHTTGDKWSGTATAVDTDTGFFSNRNTGDAGTGYTHVGFFFDASEDTWRLLSAYDSEPEAPINLNSPSLQYGDMRAGNVTFGNVTVSGTVDGRDVAADGAKLDGIESGATADQTASEILTAIKTVDGTGSGLDADTVDGLQGSQFLRSDANDTSTGTVAFGTGTLDPDSFANNSGGFGLIADGGGWSARGLFVTGGTGQSAAMATGSGNVYLGTQDGSNAGSMATWLQVAQSNKVADFKANPTVNSNAIWHAGNDGSGSGLDADTVDTYHLEDIIPAHSGSDFADGTLVTTDIPAGGSSGASFVIEVTGKSYTTGAPPFQWIGQGYLYNNTIINHTAAGTYAPSYYKVFNDSNNYLAFWWPRVSYWNSFSVHVRDAGGSWNNRVQSISNSTEPSSSKKVQTNIEKVWTAFNDGSGSGLDADTLDGVQGSSYLRSDTADTMTGNLTIDTSDAWNAGNGMLNVGGAGDGRLQVRHIWGKSASSAGTDDLWLQYSNSSKHVQIGASGGNNNLYVSGNLYANGYFGGSLVWHAGNDGSGSGLDADTVDGIHASKIVYDKGGSQIGTTSSWDITTPGMYGVASGSAFTGTNNPSSAISGIYTYGVLTVFEVDGQGIGQLYTPHTGNKIALRTGWNNGNWYPWQQVWTSTTATGAGYVDVATGNYGTIKVDDDRSVTWAGYAIRDDWVLMSDGASNCGIYNDTDNEWSVLCRRNAEVELYYNGSVQAETQNGFFLANGQMRAPIYYESANTAYYFDGGNTGDSIRVAGDIVAYYSDERLKDFQGRINGALDKVLKINGYYYTENERAKELGYNTGKTQVGVSAQEVEAVLPEIIKDAPIGHGYKTVQYERLVPLLIEAIKEQNDKIDRLEAMVEKLINTNKG